MYIYNPLIRDLIIPPGAVQIIDIDISNKVNELHFLVSTTMVGGSSSVTGLDLRLHSGLGTKDPVPTAYLPYPYVLGGTTYATFGDNYEPVDLVAPASDQIVDSESNTTFFLEDVRVCWPGWIRMRFENLDSAFPARVTILISS